MKIIIIDHEPYSPKRKSIFFEEEFVNNGYEFEFWSVWKLLSFTKNVKYNYAYENSHVFYITKWVELKERFNQLDTKNTFIFVECGFNSHSWKLFKYLDQRSFKWGRISYYHNPTVNFYFNTEVVLSVAPKVKPSLKTMLKKLMKNINNVDYLIFHYLKRFNPGYLERISKPNIVFQTGAYLKDVIPNTKYIALNYFDVETFNRTVKETPLLDYDYIVFSDIYLGKHPDLEIHHGSNYMNVEEYYSYLNAFFSKCESTYGMPVVIAAHPKSNYENEFYGRLIIKDCTANLVVNSKIFMHHGSLSIAFAMLAQKPIIQFYNSKFLESIPLLRMVRTMKTIDKQIDVLTINTDEVQDIAVKAVNSEKYNEVLDKFFRAVDPSQQNFNIIIKGIHDHVVW